MATNDNSDKLTPSQQRAIFALLSERDVKAAAQAAKVGERTLHRWLKEDPAFQQALAEAETQAMAEAARRLAADAITAAQTLKEIMDDKNAPAAARVNAAKAWLALTPAFREHITLENRITELERKIGEKN